MMEKYLVTFDVEMHKEDTEKNIEAEIVRRLDICMNDGEDMWMDRSSVLVLKEKNS
jgi:hypothetical protein